MNLVFLSVKNACILFSLYHRMISWSLKTKLIFLGTLKILFHRGLASLLLLRHLLSITAEPREQSVSSSQAAFKMLVIPPGAPSDSAWAPPPTLWAWHFPSLNTIYTISLDLCANSTSLLQIYFPVHIILSCGVSILLFNISTGFYMQRLEFPL